MNHCGSPLAPSSARVFGRNAAVLIVALLARACAASAQPAEPLPLIGTIDLSHYLFSTTAPDAAVVGLVAARTLVTARSDPDGKATLDLWNVETGRVTASILAPTPIDPASVAMSPDGKRLLAVQSVGEAPVPVYYPNRVYVWDVATRRLSRTIDFGPGVEASGAFFDQNNSEQAIVTVNAPLDASEDGRFVRVDLRNGRQGRPVPYRYAAYLWAPSVLFSPDGKLLLGIYASSGQHPGGSLDVFDATTLHPVASFDARGGPGVVTGPAYFIDSHRAAVGSLLYDTRSQQGTRLLSRHPGRYFLAGIPGRRGYGLFVSGEGMELWNMVEQTMTTCWDLPLAPPDPKLHWPAAHIMPSAAYVSPDGKELCFLAGGTVRT